MENTSKYGQNIALNFMKIGAHFLHPTDRCNFFFLISIQVIANGELLEKLDNDFLN